MPNTRKRKTRAQRKALIVAIVSSVLSTGFLVGSIISGIHLPKREDLEERYEGNYLESIIKGQDDSYYILASSKNEGNLVDDGFLYHYNSHDKLIEKHSLFEDIEEKFGINNLVSIDGLVTSYESDSIFIFSQNSLFRYKGVSDNELELVSYTDQFPGRIINVASDEEDIFVVSLDARQYRIDRFKENDDAYTPVNSGYIYEVNNNDGFYRLVCSKGEKIYSLNVEGDYLYIYTGDYIRKINKNLTGSNYRVIYEKEYKEIKENNPSLNDEEITNQIVSKYGWISYNYDTHNVDIPENQLSQDLYSFYIHPDSMAGTVNYEDKVFFVDKRGGFYRCKIDELDETDQVVNSSDDFFKYDEDFKFPYQITASPDLNAFGYDGVGTTAMVYYEESTPMMSVLDLENETLKYTVKVSTRVDRSFYNETKDTIYYKFSDPVNRKAGLNYLSSFVVRDEINSKVIEVLFIVFIIIAVISFVTTTISWLCYIFKPVMMKILMILKGLKKHWIIYIILFPSVFILGLFCYYPGIAAIFTSFYDYKAGISQIKTWNNFANYVQIFGNVKSLAHFGNMVLFLAADVVLAIIPPLIFAFFLTLMRHKKVSGVIRTLLFIPGIIPGIAGLLIWRTGIYGDYGLVNNIIKSSGGTPILFFQQSDYTNMLWLILMGFPFVGSYLIFYGAMMNIPSSYYEAAELDGISVFKRFIKIDIPLCLPQIKYVVIMTIIASIQNFSRIYVAMGGMPGVVSTPIVEMYMLMKSTERNYGLASAYATVLFVILFFLTYLSMRP